MLKALVLKYGIDKINTLTKYSSILTLHQFGERGRFTNDLTTTISLSDELFATEKIDGTNVRIICLGNEYLIGSRGFILHYSEDLCYNPSQSIVENIKKLVNIPTSFRNLTIIYGELFGGKVSKNSKQYGAKDELGFRVFDIAQIKDLSILEKNQEEISKWREHQTSDGLVYGQDFLSVSALQEHCNRLNLPIVPRLNINIPDWSHQSVLAYLNQEIPQTNVALSAQAGMKPEGIIVRNADRSKIVKLRFEDYKRTLR